MRRLLWILPVVALFAGVGVTLFRSGPGTVGRPAPGFELETLDGDSIALSGLRDKPVVINFWASWCDPCRDEAAELARSARELGSIASFLGVNILDGRTEARRYVEEFAIPYESVRDARGVVAKRYGVTGVPETVFVDRRGNIAGRYVGAFTGQLERLVRELAELEPGRTLDISGRGETRPVP